MEIYFVIAGLGGISGFLSGLVGIGGGIVMAPLLLYVPPLFGMNPLPMQTVAGLTIVQGVLGSVAGAVIHKKFQFVSDSLSIYMGSSIFVTALLGGASARYVSDNVLLFVFACLAFTAAFLMLVPVKMDYEKPDIHELEFSKIRAVVVASGVGGLGGLVGQGGSFILIPLMTSFVHIPTRIAIGSNLAIVLLSSFAGVIGKAVTGQIEWLMTIPIALTVVPAAIAGGRVSRGMQIINLRRILAVLIALAAIRMWYTLLQ